MLGRLISRVAQLDGALAESRAAQRAMHNQLVELRGNVRARPFLMLALRMCMSHAVAVTATAAAPTASYAHSLQPMAKWCH